MQPLASSADYQVHQQQHSSGPSAIGWTIIHVAIIWTLLFCCCPTPETKGRRLPLSQGHSLSHFGHLMRRTDSLEKTLMLGKIEGVRRRGWHPLAMGTET